MWADSRTEVDGFWRGHRSEFLEDAHSFSCLDKAATKRKAKYHTIMKRLATIALTLISVLAALLSCEKAPFVTMIGPRSYTFSREGGTQTFAFSCNRDWSFSPSDSWVTISPSSGTAADGDITVTIKVSPNTTYDPRTATLTLKVEELSEMITVTQDTDLGLIVSPTAFELTNVAQDIEIELLKNVQYSVAIDESGAAWIKQGGTRALSTDKITFHLASNESYDEREGKITFKQIDGPLTETVIIKQAPKESLVVEIITYDIEHEGGPLEINVMSNIEYDVSTESSWIHYLQTKALTNSIVCLSIDKNESFSSREGTVVISQRNGSLSQTITVQQAGKESISVTGSATNITESSSTISSYAIVDPALISSIQYGIEYSYNDLTTNATSVLATRIDNDGLYSVEIEGLKSNTQYFYRSYFLHDAIRTYGEIKSFKTNSFTATVSTLEATVQDWKRVTLMGSYNDDCVGSVDRFASFRYSDVYSSVDDLLSYGETIDSDQLSSGLFSVTLSSLRPSKKYYYLAVIQIHDRVIYGAVESFTTKEFLIEMIDMGLPSGVKWANGNIGATEPEDPGYYFAFGETSPKENYTWETYKWYDSNTSSITKYFGTGVLSNEDDAAYAYSNGDWRLPTEADFNELKNKSNCDWESTTINGIKGFLFTSIRNGNQIFFPCGGRMNGTVKEYPDYADYMTNKYTGNQTCDRCMIWKGVTVISFSDREHGLSVRPVSSK